MANEQSLMAGALMSVWIFALILLVPVPRDLDDRRAPRRTGHHARRASGRAGRGRTSPASH